MWFVGVEVCWFVLVGFVLVVYCMCKYFIYDDRYLFVVVWLRIVVLFCWFCYWFFVDVF